MSRMIPKTSADLVAHAVCALGEAANDLGVDALALARWLHTKRHLAKLLSLLAAEPTPRVRPSEPSAVVPEALLDEYLAFLDTEAQRRR